MRLFGNNKEQHILSLFAKGDDRAMDKLYGTYADYLAQVCLRYIGNREDLHDVLPQPHFQRFAGRPVRRRIMTEGGNSTYVRNIL